MEPFLQPSLFSSLCSSCLLLGGKLPPPLSTPRPLRALLLLGIDLILALPLLNLLTMNLPLENLLLALLLVREDAAVSIAGW